jgi:hypothetical protein
MADSIMIIGAGMGGLAAGIYGRMNGFNFASLPVRANLVHYVWCPPNLGRNRLDEKAKGSKELGSRCRAR